MYKFPENFRLADNVHLVPVQPLRKQDNVGIYCRVSTYERKQMKKPDGSDICFNTKWYELSSNGISMTRILDVACKV